MTDPDAEYLAEWERERDAMADPSDPEADPSDEFWSSRQSLAHVLATARANQAGPWATLGVILARVVAQTPPFVMLPGHGSLNLFIGLVGPSGGGKGWATGTAERALDFEEERFTTAGIGSGEGLVHLYARRIGKDKELDQHTTSVLLDVAEIDTMTALSGRNSSTIMAELRKTWMGERLGFAYADPDKKLSVRAHAYRLTMTVGIQPKRAGALLADSDGGTPQRFVWLPVSDPYMPDDPPAGPSPWAWKLPPLVGRNPTGQVVLDMCDSATAATKAHRLKIGRGQQSEDDLNSHANFARLKVAAALGLLDEHLGITEEDWRLAGLVMDQSDQQRALVSQAIRKVAERQNKAQGLAEGVRAALASEVMDEAAVRRVGRAIVRKLQRSRAAGDEWMSHSVLRRATVSGSDRGYFDRVITDLVATGEIVTDSSDRAVKYSVR